VVIMTAGYSATKPLVSKLGFEPGMRAHDVNPPSTSRRSWGGDAVGRVA